MRILSQCSFILSSRFPEEDWDDVEPNLLEFEKMLEDEPLVEAMAHMTLCSEPACCAANEGFVLPIVSINPAYPATILRLLCRYQRLYRETQTPGVP